MASIAWHARRNEVAADRILDVAGELFAAHDAAAVGMGDIAKAAGCSRTTLYRYYQSREALHTAYVHREAQGLFRRMIEAIDGIDDPVERLIAGCTTSLALVRQSPALISWFSAAQPPIGGELAEHSDVIAAMTTAFLGELDTDTPEAHARRARWLVRVMISLLTFPGTDAADERRMLEEFVLPVAAPTLRGTILGEEVLPAL